MVAAEVPEDGNLIRVESSDDDLSAELDALSSTSSLRRGQIQQQLQLVEFQRAEAEARRKRQAELQRL